MSNKAICNSDDRDLSKIKELVSKGKISHASKLISNIPNMWSLVKLGSFYKENGNTIIFEMILRRLEMIIPTNDKGWSDKGAAFYFLGYNSNAIRYINEALRLNPRFAGAWANKGKILGHLGFYDEGIQCFDKAIEVGSNTYELADAWSDKSALLDRLGRYEEAIMCCERAIELNPALTDAWSNKCAALINLKKYEEALESIEVAIRLNSEFDKAWANKGLIFQYLKRFDEAISCFEKAVTINPCLENAWLNVGVLYYIKNELKNSIKCFERVSTINPKNVSACLNKGCVLDALGEYHKAIKCFNRVLELDPKHLEGWSNKAASLLGMGRFEEAIECCDNVLKIDPNHIGSLSNKGVAMGYLGSYEDANKCFEQMINIDPDYIGGHVNLGISYLNLHKYDAAIEPFKKAREIAIESGQTDASKELYKYELWSINTSELQSRLRPLDEKFLSCLGSQDLTTLKISITQLYVEFEVINDEFSQKDLPAEVKDFLFSKRATYQALSSALNFEKIDLVGLEKAKKVFEKWNREDLAIEVNSVDTFVRIIRSYKGIDEITRSDGVQLLNILSNSHIFRNIFADKASDKPMVEFKRSSLNLGPTEDALRIETANVLDNFSKKSIRICLVQLDIELTKKFPYELKDKCKIKERILCALELANDNDVDIICFPELSFSNDFINYAKEYKDMVIIGGSYYKDNYNICPVIIRGQEYPVYKIHPSPYIESKKATSKGMNSGKDIKIFKTKDGKISISVLICIDYLCESWRLYHLVNPSDKVNIIFNPQFNRDIDRFQRMANSDCENYSTDIMQINAMEYGCTCAIGLEHHKAIERFISEGFRKKDGITYKICEALSGQEIAIMIDIDVCGTISMPTPLYAEPRFSILGRYIFKDGSWSNMDSI